MSEGHSTLRRSHRSHIGSRGALTGPSKSRDAFANNLYNRTERLERELVKPTKIRLAQSEAGKEGKLT